MSEEAMNETPGANGAEWVDDEDFLDGQLSIFDELATGENGDEGGASHGH